ncbi:hypothetical protein [Polyangium jinanense]|uniref:Uncharacterized protein n=1 Tax=Polyangium jinanense TaxID=2829994 RepID=A0A9X3X2Q8_9BACT|nr:hypothetical protein [Polyangium jinanense]MDC3954809.1 hypothetical protein [Polyangium jinanense]MDC3981420.1 hypothetical protein [Polyangium jinanense]
MNKKGAHDLLADGSIAADERLARVIGAGGIPASVLLRFACDCAARALDGEREARREPEASSCEAIRRVQQWIEGSWPWKPAPEEDKPSPNGFFGSIALADAMLKRNLAPARVLADVGAEARRAVEAWDARAPRAAAEAAAIVAEAAAEMAAAEADAEHEWKAEEMWTDVELDAAMQAAASRGPGAWAAKSELDAGAIATRLVQRRQAAASRAAIEVSRLAAVRAAEDVAASIPEETAPGGFTSWLRSLWTPRTPPADSAAARTRAEQAHSEEHAWQIAHLSALLRQDDPES